MLRGPELVLGHGIFMESEQSSLPTTVDGALDLACEIWSRVYHHLGEVFTGDTRARGAILGAGKAGSIYHLEEAELADRPVTRLVEVSPLSKLNVYATLRAAALP
jgi:hypothetical protein